MPRRSDRTIRRFVLSMRLESRYMSQFETLRQSGDASLTELEGDWLSQHQSNRAQLDIIYSAWAALSGAVA